MDELQQRINEALEIAYDGVFDGSHHKQWVIDQMVRALTGCPKKQVFKTDPNGSAYNYEIYGESGDYNKWLSEFEDGGWDKGVAP